MNSVLIDFDKYIELRDAVLSNPIRTFYADWHRVWPRIFYKCEVTFKIKQSVNANDVELDADIVLDFDNEQDCIWFKLKHL